MHDVLPVFNTTDHMLYVYHGDRGELFRWAPNVWTRLFPSGTPLPLMTGEVGLYDPIRDRILIFFGGQTYFIQLGASLSWGLLATSGAGPTGGSQHVIYDALRDRVVLDDQTNLWELSLSGTPAWRQMAVQGNHPPNNASIFFMSDPNLDRMIVGTMDDITQDVWYLKFISGTQTGVPGTHTRRLALEGPTTNPVSEAVTVGFSLLSSAPAELRLCDVKGRVLWSRQVGSLGAGYHRLSIDSNLPAGVYFGRLLQEGQSAKAKFVRIP